MHYLKKIALLSAAMISFSSSFNAYGKTNDISQISMRMQKAMNNNDKKLLEELFKKDSLKQIKNEYTQFKKQYRNTIWEIKPSKNINQNFNLLDIELLADCSIEGQDYELKSRQTVKLIIDKDKIKSYKVINAESTLRSKDSELNIQIKIPEKVLTGSRYDIDLIIEEPLGDYIIAAGIIEVEQTNFTLNNTQKILLKPIGAGGLFKTVSAPIKEGSQTWAALITHPKGLFAITKVVQVENVDN